MIDQRHISLAKHAWARYGEHYGGYGTSTGVRDLARESGMSGRGFRILEAQFGRDNLDYVLPEHIEAVDWEKYEGIGRATRRDILNFVSLLRTHEFTRAFRIAEAEVAALRSEFEPWGPLC